MDQILKGARRNAGAVHEAGPACLDAETLAAWADDGVGAERAREIEMHVASCTRCQEMSAAFFRAQEAVAAPGAATTVVPFKRNRLMYWLPIAAGIAATVVIGLNLLQRETPAPDLTMSKATPAEAPAPAPPAAGLGSAQAQQGQSAAAADSRATNRQLAEPKAAQRLDQLTAAELRKERVAKPTAPGPVKPDAAPVQPPAGRVGGVAGGIPATTPPPPPPAMAAPPPTPTPAVTAATPVIAPTQNAQTRATSESLAFRAAVDTRVIAEFSSNDLALSLTLSRVAPVGAGGGGRGGGGAGRGGAAGGRGGAGAAVVADASKADAVAYWRILAPGVVEKSTDRAVWTAIAIDPPPQGLAAGAAPLPSVCWLAGKGGLVMLSTDGRTFSRVAAPTDADLEAVAASNALQATVRTVDGRTFITTDGGKTWK